MMQHSKLDENIIQSKDLTKEDGQEIAELLALCEAGNEEAWRTLFAKYSRLIYSIPRNFGFDPSECDEVFQEASIEILKHIGKVKKPESFYSWLMTVTRRVCIRRLHFQQKINKKEAQYIFELEAFELEDLEDSVHNRLEQMEKQSLLTHLIKFLDQKCQ